MHDGLRAELRFDGPDVVTRLTRAAWSAGRTFARRTSRVRIAKLVCQEHRPVCLRDHSCRTASWPRIGHATAEFDVMRPPDVIGKYPPSKRVVHLADELLTWEV